MAEQYKAERTITAVFKEEQVAWETIHQQYDEDENGILSKQKVTA